MIARKLTVLLMLLCAGAAAAQPPERGQTKNLAAAALDWPPIAATARPWTYWWWMGSAVDPDNLARELGRYHRAGLGGVHVIPIYGAKGFESRYVEYLSPKWMELLRFTLAETQRLGMGVDMTTGSGWCFGGPNISWRDATARPVVKTYKPAAGERLAQRFDRQDVQALVASASGGKCLELTDRIGPDGAVDWVAPGGDWTVYAVSQRPTGQKVKRAAPGGEGPMLNPFFPEAIQHYLPRFSEAFALSGVAAPRAMYHDSYEYTTSWAADLFQQFERRRGYRLQPHVAELFAADGDEQTARVKCDYRETVSDVMTEQFLPPWVHWAHALGCLTRNQAHGSPGNLLDLYAAADIPETEMFNKDRNPLVAKFASSAAHTSGKNLVSSETGTWLAEHFTETLDDLKRLMDDMFVSGINHVFYHGTCYSPDDASWPGWLFYAATEMNPRNAIWHDVAWLNAYIARCQSVLQAGRPDNDILLYWPIHDFWHNPKGLVQQLTVHDTAWLRDQPIGVAAARLWGLGYAFDYLSDRQLAAARARAGSIELPGGLYRVIVVPPAQHVPLPTVRNLLELAEQGATVIFQDRLPRDVPGLGDLEKRRAALAELLASVQPAASRDRSVGVAKVGKGRVLVGPLDAALAQVAVTREPMADLGGLAFVRRVRAAGDISAPSGGRGWDYLIVNRGQKPLDDWITLGTPAASALWMDAMTGRIGLAATRDDAENTQVYAQLQPGESLILRTFARRRVNAAAWTYWQPRGKAIALTGTWSVAFQQGGPALPKPLETAKLDSWTVLGDDAARTFAGTAQYRLLFDAPAAGDSAWQLDLGTVCQSATVSLNGRELGARIMPPYRLLLDQLQPKGNELLVRVTNLSANRIRDLDRRHVVWRNFHDINFVSITYKRFDASNWPLRDSGLLGPVRLQAMERFDPGR
jgi:hypothetical protein